MNAKKQEGGLSDWLTPPEQPPADIYAVGFQEIVDLNAVNVALDGGKAHSRSKFWREQISECLESTRERYRLVMEKHLVGLLLCVYVRESMYADVKDARAVSTGVGLLGMMGNKGGVCVRLSVFDSSVCFVCSHLAAHRENLQGRNADFRNIVERSFFPAQNHRGGDGGGGGGGGGSSGASGEGGGNSNGISTEEPTRRSALIRPR